MRRIQWLLAASVAALVLIVGGTWTYIHVIQKDAPAPLALDAAPSGSGDSGSTTTTSTAASSGSSAVDPATLDGTWKATSGSQAGYRVGEILFGQNTEAVGRTSDVDGELTIAGTSVTAASVTVDMTTVTSDESKRDNQFRGRIMNVAKYPTATFTLTKPIDVGSMPADGAQVTVPATGDLTLHGTKKGVTVNLAARNNGDTVEVKGTIPITFADWGIPNPSFGPVSTDDHGVLEFLVKFARAAEAA